MLEIILALLGPAWMRSKGFPAAQRSRWQSKVHINRIYKVYKYYVCYLALSASLVQKYLMNYWIDLHAIRSIVMFPEGIFNEFSLALRDWYVFHFSEVKKNSSSFLLHQSMFQSQRSPSPFIKREPVTMAMWRAGQQEGALRWTCIFY